MINYKNINTDKVFGNYYFKNSIINKNETLLIEINKLNNLFNSYESDKAILHYFMKVKILLKI